MSGDGDRMGGRNRPQTAKPQQQSTRVPAERPLEDPRYQREGTSNGTANGNGNDRDPQKSKDAKGSPAARGSRK